MDLKQERVRRIREHVVKDAFECVERKGREGKRATERVEARPRCEEGLEELAEGKGLGCEGALETAAGLDLAGRDIAEKV